MSDEIQNSEEQEVVARPRRRRRKVASEDPVSPAHEQRVREAEEAEERKAMGVAVEKYYEVRGGKLIHVMRKKNGNKHRSYVGDVTKGPCRKFYDDLKAQGVRIDVLPG